MATPRDIPIWLRVIINVAAFIGVGATLMGWVQREVGILIFICVPIYLIWEVAPWTTDHIRRRPFVTLGAFMVVGSVLGAAAWWVWKSNIPATATPSQGNYEVIWVPPAPIVAGTPLSSIQLNAVSTVEGVFVYKPPVGTVLPIGRNNLDATFCPKDSTKYPIHTEARSIVVNPAEVRPAHSEPTRIQPPSVTLTVPEIAAKFIQATSPGVMVLNVSKEGGVVRDPSCNVTMWNLSRNPPLSLPTFNQNNPGQYIKHGDGLLLASLDNPSMKPQISEGDKVFGFVSVDCPDCKAMRSYWLYVVYGRPAEAWYSEIPEGQKLNPIVISKGLQEANWDVDAFMRTVPHDAKITPELLPGR
jgi:hypothetical protein